MSKPLPDMPPGLIKDTGELLVTLESTVANLRDFTEKLRRATRQSREGATDDLAGPDPA